MSLAPSPHLVELASALDCIAPIFEHHFALTCQVLARYGFAYQRLKTLRSAVDLRPRASFWHQADRARFQIELYGGVYRRRLDGVERVHLHIGLLLVTRNGTLENHEPLLRATTVECGPPGHLQTKPENVRRVLEQHFPASVVASVVHERMSH